MRVYNPVLLICMQSQRAVHKLGAHPTLLPFLTRTGGSWKQTHDRGVTAHFFRTFTFAKPRGNSSF